MEKNSIIAVVCSIVLCGVSIIYAGYWQSKYKSAVQQHRYELGLARARAEQYGTIIGRAEEINGRIGESLSRQSATISGLREQIQQLKESYFDMENLLNDYYRSSGYNNSDTDSQ